MPITLISNIVPANNNTFYLVEDNFLKGGYQSVADLAGRDAIDSVNLKPGMAVYTQDTNKLWILASDLTTWNEFSSGGGVLIVADLAARDAIPASDRKPGMMVYTEDASLLWILMDDLVTWSEVTTGVPARFKVDVSTPHDLAVMDIWDFELDMKSSVGMLLNLTASGPCQVEFHGTPNRTDPNPFLFIATWDHLSDDGSTIMSDGSRIYGRRYSFLANLEQPLLGKSIFGRITNTGDAVQKVTLTLELLPQ
jgi:hypothetical protein